jgi:SAM-dependent MidA family methyltransferase
MPSHRGRSRTGDSPAAVPEPISFADFVDDALFHPDWGYYATGGVRFGPGGHYDTYPLALSPLFGRMVAEYGFRAWRRAKQPASFEICELGAGNGQLCLDTLLWVHERGRHGGTRRHFADALRYRIFERSPALVDRQRQQLGPLAETVRWTRTNLARNAPHGTPLAPAGLIVANEVLDCLPHHKVIRQPNGATATVFVTPHRDGRALGRRELAAVMADAEPTTPVEFRESLAPLRQHARLAAFIARHRADLLAGDGAASPAYFASPEIESLLDNAGRLYGHADALWIDYGDLDRFHRRAAETRRVFAGPPRSGLRVYDDPGRHDITFMVDFSAVARAARQAGWRVVYYGPQSELARRTGVALDRDAVDLVVRHRALRWMLAVAGVGPERSWHRPAVSWSPAAAPGRVPVRRYVEQSIREFYSERSPFKLLITRR